MIKETLMGVALAVLVAVASGCASNASMSCCDNMKNGDMKSSDATSATAKALMKVDEDWSNYVATHDVDKVVSYYTEDAVVFPPNEPMVSDHAAVKKVWAGFLSDPSLKLSCGKRPAPACRRTMGYTSGPYSLSMNGPDGKPMSEKGKFLCVWQKQSDGKWKSVRDMWNADSK